MKKILIALFLTFSFFNCQSQEDQKKDKAVIEDENKPQTNISVKKEYDEQGNLISIDSTYTSFYSNIKKDTVLEKEFFEKFQSNFSKDFKPFEHDFMNKFFKRDPFKMNDFYTDDFFENNFKLHQNRIDKMLKKMDSLKNNYYKDQENLKPI